jgi:futalosine hydrolase
MKAVFVPSMGEAKFIFPKLSFKEWKRGISTADAEGYKVFITGVTKTPCAAAATSVFENFDITEALLTGVCGAYRNCGLAVGDIVSVRKDHFADEGLYEGETFKSVFEMGFGFLEKSFIMFNEIKHLQNADSNTVSFLDGNGAISQILHKSTGAQVENMEGASFGYVCKLFGIKCYQIRAVSNFCGIRSEQEWDFKKAVLNLETFYEGFNF